MARNTVDRSIRTYRAGGFEALAPAPRNCQPVTPAAMLALAEALKHEVPRRTAAQVGQIIRTAEGWAPSGRTFQRLFVRLVSTPPPGDMLVLDWVQIGPLSVFCAVLAWSRFRFVLLGRPGPVTRLAPGVGLRAA